jgi:hypothetical protein
VDNSVKQIDDRLREWIAMTFAPARRANPLTSYAWKHRFEGSEKGFYVTNDQFKAAMLAAGYKPTKGTADDLNWRFKVKLTRRLSRDELKAV